MSNLSLSSNFSNTFFPSGSLGTKEKETSYLAGCFFTEAKSDYTKNNVLKFIVENTSNFGRSDTLYFLCICTHYNEDLNFLDEEQASYYPTNTVVRMGYRCNPKQVSSKADTLRVFHLKNGLVELVNFEGHKNTNCVKFSHKFFLLFCLHKLSQQRQSLIEGSRNRMMTEFDFLERVELETLIYQLEKEISEFTPRVDSNSQEPKMEKKRAKKDFQAL